MASLIPLVWLGTAIVLLIFFGHFLILLYHWYRFSIKPTTGGIMLVGYLGGSAFLALSLIGTTTALVLSLSS